MRSALQPARLARGSEGGRCFGQHDSAALPRHYMGWRLACHRCRQTHCCRYAVRIAGWGGDVVRTRRRSSDLGFVAGRHRGLGWGMGLAKHRKASRRTRRSRTLGTHADAHHVQNDRAPGAGRGHANCTVRPWWLQLAVWGGYDLARDVSPTTRATGQAKSTCQHLVADLLRHACRDMALQPSAKASSQAIKQKCSTQVASSRFAQ